MAHVGEAERSKALCRPWAEYKGGLIIPIVIPEEPFFRVNDVAPKHCNL
jgi:hypothetical protein